MSRFRFLRGPAVDIFALGLLIRALPELVVPTYPVGYDVLSAYVPFTSALPDTAALQLFGWYWAPLVPIFLRALLPIFAGNVFLLMKVFASILAGIFVSSFYLMARWGLGWSVSKSTTTSVLFLLQPAILRLEWDQFRAEFALTLFFLMLATVRFDLLNNDKRRSFLILGFSLLIVFSHELVGLLLLIPFLYQTGSYVLRCHKGPSGILPLLPSMAILTWQVFDRLFIGFSFSSHLTPVTSSPGSQFAIFTNYLLIPTSLGTGYLDVLLGVGSLTLYWLVATVFLAFQGFFKDKTFLPLTVWLMISSFSLVFVPSFAISYFYWWMLLLCIPFTIYAGNGLDRLGVFVSTVRYRLCWVGLLMLGIIAVGYATSAIALGYPNGYSYMPAGMVESSVKFSDIPDIERAFAWVNGNVPQNAQLLVPENFQGFAVSLSRHDLLVRIGPPNTPLESILSDHGMLGPGFAVFYFDEVTGFKGQILASFGRIVVCDFQR